jgi:hypothetical protein
VLCSSVVLLVVALAYSVVSFRVFP